MIYCVLLILSDGQYRAYHLQIFRLSVKVTEDEDGALRHA